MGTVTGMLTQARKLLGTTEHPAGSNHNGVTTWYGFDGAWCDMSVSYEAAHSDNVAAIGGKFAYVPAHMAWGRAKYGIHHGSVPPAGAVVGYRWDRAKGTTSCDHVGICEKNNGDGTFYSLEGNIGDAFRREHRDLTYVSCWFMPKYDNTPSSEDDMPNYVSLGMKKAQTVKSGQAKTAVFDVEYSDKAKSHADGTFPGVLSGGKNGAQFVIEVDASGVAGSMRLVETDPAKKYAVTKAYPLRPIGVETFVGLCDPNQHLYVEVHPSADGAANVAVKAQYWNR
jgi:hypothetical protein